MLTFLAGLAAGFLITVAIGFVLWLWPLPKRTELPDGPRSRAAPFSTPKLMARHRPIGIRSGIPAVRGHAA